MIRLFLIASQKKGGGSHPEVRQRRRRREPLRRVAEDVAARLERRRDHPVDGKDHDGEDQQAEDVTPSVRSDATPAFRRDRRAGLRTEFTRPPRS